MLRGCPITGFTFPPETPVVATKQPRRAIARSSQLELERTGIGGRQDASADPLPALDDIATRETPAIQVAGRHDRPARRRRADERLGRRRSAAMMRDDDKVRASQIIRRQQAALAASLDVPRQQQHASASGDAQHTRAIIVVPRHDRGIVEPGKAHAVPGPA